MSIAKILTCRSCNLCLNQEPLLDENGNGKVFWVGLSAVKVDDVESSVPLCPTTRSGALVSRVEELFPDLSFYKTNLVKCLPLQNDKIRYPSSNEMQKCFPNLINEFLLLKPKLVILLGKQVQNFVLNNLDDELIKIGSLLFSEKYNFYLLPVDHPSFILVYRRRFILEYIDNISLAINEMFERKKGKQSKGILTLQA